MAFAAVTDLFTMTIPNRLTLGLAVAFFLLAPIAGLGWQDILSHMAGGATMLLAGILLFSLGWLGGGDAKLLAAASLWLGFDQLAMFLTYTAAFGGALALAILAYRGDAGERLPAARLGRPSAHQGRRHALWRGHRGRGPIRLPGDRLVCGLYRLKRPSDGLLSVNLRRRLTSR